MLNLYTLTTGIKSFGKKYYSNCWLEMLILRLKGKVKKVMFERNGIGFSHALGLTKRGNVVHFKRVKGREKKFSFILKGRLQVLKLKK